ncbi:hypothetical protein FRB96_004744 [Tulasnella sp. 330]|nr:hypothetical protein FRB96_004744 [Tulasnella sp. 330]KAG8876782.1 hypothetical protein FRB97_003933 [Tulasnella sp. 331]KAG8882044.1 hypothetical protein FRB98_003962 [Tulasnella sp. 332]
MVLTIESKDLAMYPTRHVNAPPPYTRRSPPAPLFASPSPSSHSKSWQALPKHILLNIIEACIPSYSPRSPAPHIEAIYWVNRSLRLVSHAMYIASMHYLRTSFLSSYHVSVKPPYTSEPFPLIPPEASLPPNHQLPLSPIQSLQRETAVLDKFIAVKSTEDLRNYESPELHLDLDLFKDIFDLMQPKSRMEDLVLKYGMRAGVISLLTPPLPPSSSNSQSLLPLPLPFASVSVNFSPRKVGLVVLRRTVVEVKRDRDESLESAAKRLIKELARALGRGGR